MQLVVDVDGMLEIQKVGGENFVLETGVTNL